MITFDVEDLQGTVQTVEVPEGINLSLMEVLKASEYPVLATCGGMALCATCHVEVADDNGTLGEPSDAELDMLDTLPHASSYSRLACQIQIGTQLNGLLFKLKEEH
ncbi:MAG: 2Fe-2S iron-sulfur cluster-binding protein [Bacteroidota bacterium]|nr:2Fe-2S iron-sulfur cluster-binding protein [Bacteroidota bacterium]